MKTANDRDNLSHRSESAISAHRERSFSSAACRAPPSRMVRNARSTALFTCSKLFSRSLGAGEVSAYTVMARSCRSPSRIKSAMSGSW